MTRFENWAVRVLSLAAGAVLFAGFPGHAAQALEMNVIGIAPAYQVGRHDSQNRFCYDGSCIIHGEGKIDINRLIAKNEVAGNLVLLPWAS